MGFLLEIVDKKVKNIAEFYKINTIYFYKKYTTSDADVYRVNIGDLRKGFFYHFHYNDDSNWLKYSPIFLFDYKKVGEYLFIIGVNLNFIPFEFRVAIFDRLMVEENFTQNTEIGVDYVYMYNLLREYGFEYAIVEYNIKQIKIIHQINNSIIEKFLYSSHPKNKYEPKKLYFIWSNKIKQRDERYKEVLNGGVLKELDKMNSDIGGNYTALKGHIDRIKKSIEKYGNK